MEDLLVNNTETVSSIMKVHLMFLFLWQSTFRLSDVGIGVLLKFFSILLGVLAKFLVVPFLKHLQRLFQHL